MDMYIEYRCRCHTYTCGLSLLVHRHDSGYGTDEQFIKVLLTASRYLCDMDFCVFDLAGGEFPSIKSQMRIVRINEENRVKKLIL